MTIEQLSGMSYDNFANRCHDDNCQCPGDLRRAPSGNHTANATTNLRDGAFGRFKLNLLTFANRCLALAGKGLFNRAARQLHFSILQHNLPSRDFDPERA